MREYALGFMFSPDRENVVLITKNRPNWQKGLINGLGGLIEKQDRISLAAMIREFHEETGIVHEDWEYRGWFWSIGIYRVHLFRCFSDQFASVRTMTDEPVLVCSVNDMPANIIPNLKWIIPMLLDEHIIRVDILQRNQE